MVDQESIQGAQVVVVVAISNASTRDFNHLDLYTLFQ